jgi:hypothetical protein
MDVGLEMNTDKTYVHVPVLSPTCRTTTKNMDDISFKNDGKFKHFGMTVTNRNYILKEIIVD